MTNSLHNGSRIPQQTKVGTGIIENIYLFLWVPDISFPPVLFVCEKEGVLPG